MNKKKSNKSTLFKIAILATLTTISIESLESNKFSRAVTSQTQSNSSSDLSFADSILASNLSSEEQLALLAQLAHQQVNEYRAAQNLPLLETNTEISEQARIHSENMAKNIVEFSHDGFQERVDALKSTISYRSAAENVAYNMGYEDPANKAVEGWIGSTGHRQNMEGNYNLTGIGVAKNQDGEYYFTQIFVLEKS